MEIKFTKDEVERILTEHVRKMIPDYVRGKDVDVSFSSYGHEAEVTITEREPEKGVSV